MPSSLSRSSRPHAGALAQIGVVVFGGLATGVTWCLLSLGLERGEGLLIVPLAAAVGLYLRWFGLRGLRGAIGGASATLIAFVYAQYLFAAVRIAQTLGLPLRSTLFQMDAPLALQLARANLGWLEVGALLAAIALAVAATQFGARGE